MSESALHYLLIEAIPTAQDVAKQLELEDENEAAWRVERYGYRVGVSLAQVVTRSRPPFTQQLDIIKFVCRDLWLILFRKQIDNLRTNHRDTYVLMDHNFEYAQRMSTNLGPQKTAELGSPYLWFPAGIIRGFLARVGVESSVSFEATQLPAVSFNIFVQQ